MDIGQRARKYYLIRNRHKMLKWVVLVRHSFGWTERREIIIECHGASGKNGSNYCRTYGLCSWFVCVMRNGRWFVPAHKIDGYQASAALQWPHRSVCHCPVTMSITLIWICFLFPFICQMWRSASVALVTYIVNSCIDRSTHGNVSFSVRSGSLYAFILVALIK